MMSKKIGAILIYSFMLLACKTIFETMRHPTFDKLSILVWSLLFGFFLAIMNDFDLKVKVPNWLKRKSEQK